jgi:hypothetical protein
VPTGTSRGIAPGDPAPGSEKAGLSACPKTNPADKRIKTTADEIVLIEFILTIDFRSMAGKTARLLLAGRGDHGSNLAASRQIV